jgi:hypothetical protein
MTWRVHTASCPECGRPDGAMRRGGCEAGICAVSCPSRSRPERARGGLHKWLHHCTTPARYIRSLKVGAASRVPGICERFNGLRDPSMTLSLTGAGPMPKESTPWPACGILRLPSCSSQVHTTPKSAKGVSCIAGKRSISGRRGPPASIV